MKKFKELQAKSKQELARQEEQWQQELREGRFHLATQASAVTKVRILRKDLARLKTAASQLRHSA
ncbi:MAG: 50S ribosomal protein L29 [bacterium]|nr:50S ribosomal protein L29 [bacterium]